MLVGLTSFHPASESLFGGVHDSLEVGAVVIRERAAWKSDKLITRTHLEPWIACKHIMPVGVGHIKLLCTVFKAVVEAGARCAGFNLIFIHLGEHTSVHFAHASGEDDSVALLHVHLKVARHIQVLGVRNASLLILDILDAFIPVRVEHKLRLVVHLHKEFRIAFVHACGNAVRHFLVIATCHLVFNAKVVGIAERQEWTELECGLRVSIYQGVADKDTILVGDKDFLTLQNHATYTKRVSRHTFAIVLSDVLVTIRTVHATGIPVQAKVERRTVLNHRFIKRRQEHMAIVVNFRNRNHKKSMLLSCIGSHNGSAVVCTRLIRAQHLQAERLLKINQKILIKFKITHDKRYYGIFLVNNFRCLVSLRIYIFFATLANKIGSNSPNRQII